MKSEPQLHHIQKSIILSLAKNSPLRFTDLQPPRIPNNTFSYHLKKLVQSEYIESTPNGYVPTRKALKLIAYGATRDKSISNPKIITTLYITNKDGELLLINKNNKPFQGWYGLPSGLVHLGESLAEAAKRELTEKTKIVSDEALELAGVLDFHYLEKETEDIFAHAVAFIYRLEFDGEKELLSDMQTKYGQLSWSKLGRDNILPEVHAIKEIVEIGNNSHKSVSFVEPSQIPVLATI